MPAEPVLSDEELAEIRAVGDNRGSMLLKGATPDHEGEERPDRWELSEEQAELAARWGIDPERDLRKSRSAGLGPLQQLGAALEGLGVLRARLVEAVRVLLEVLCLGARAVGASAAWASSPVNRRRGPGSAPPPPSDVVRSESGRGLAGASIS